MKSVIKKDLEQVELHVQEVSDPAVILSKY